VIEWVKVKCPVSAPGCNGFYLYPKGGYKPETCSNFNCIHTWVHHRREYLEKIGEIKIGKDKVI